MAYLDNALQQPRNAKRAKSCWGNDWSQSGKTGEKSSVLVRSFGSPVPGVTEI